MWPSLTLSLYCLVYIKIDNEIINFWIITSWELFPFSAWANNYKLEEVNHSVVVSSLITCLIWGIMSNKDILWMNNWSLPKILYFSSYKGVTQFGTKKRKKERPRHRTAQQQYIDIFLIPWRSTNHRNVQEKHQKLLAYHLFLSLLRWPNHKPTVYTGKRNFSKSWLTELDIPNFFWNKVSQWVENQNNSIRTEIRHNR